MSECLEQLCRVNIRVKKLVWRIVVFPRVSYLTSSNLLLASYAAPE